MNETLVVQNQFMLFNKQELVSLQQVVLVVVLGASLSGSQPLGGVLSSSLSPHGTVSKVGSVRVVEACIEVEALVIGG